MAPMFSSNSFLLTSAPHPTFIFKNSRFSVFAKKGDDNSSPKEGVGSGNSSPFSFNFGNLPSLPDPKTLVPIPAASNPSSGLNFGRRKDPGTVFVAGATGQAGIRIAQTLMRQGFNVRAGVPDLGAAQELAQLAVKYKIISNDESKRLNAVNSSFQEAESIAKAIGNASKVVVTIGPGENGPSAEVTPADALKVFQAAELAKVGHVVIVYDRSSSTSASTYNVLDGLTSFFNNIFSRSQPLTIVELLQKVVETDISYTLIKTQLTDDFSRESSYNVVLSAEGSASSSNEYKVGNTKIASLVADLFSNTSVAENKVVEVYTNPSASSKTISELFGAIPEDGRRKAYAESLAKAKVEEEAVKASEKAREEAQSAKRFEEKVPKKAEATDISTENFLDKAKDITSGFDWAKFSSQLKSVVQKAEEEEDEPKVQVATARGQAKARSLPSLKAVAKTPARQTPPPKLKVAAKAKTKGKQPEPQTEKRKFFGGLFQQDTIYMDDA